jgi:malate dehydrogenase
MELDDCAFPLLEKVVVTDDPTKSLLMASIGRCSSAPSRAAKGWSAATCCAKTARSSSARGRRWRGRRADVRVVVVGNPANTNCLIAMNNAKDVPADRFGALTRLDENRAYAQLAAKAGVSVTEVSNVTIWGNHSATQYPDAENAKINGRPAMDVITHYDWLRGEFIETVQKRGAAIIAARGKSSALSAANAALDHVMSFEQKTPEGHWFSAAVCSDGSYGIDKGLIFSFPVQSDGQGGWSIVQGLGWSDFAKGKIAATLQELREERDIIADML